MTIEGYRGLQGVTENYVLLQREQGVTEGYGGFQEDTRVYSRLQDVTRGSRELQRVTRGYKG